MTTPQAQPASPAPSAQTCAVIYARMSLDSTGQARGISRQVEGEDATENAVALCQARAWAVAGTFSDNDLSALTGVHRPGYAGLLAAIERGDARIIVTYQLSRLWRNRRERAEGMELLKAKRVKIVTVKGPELDLSTAYGRAMVGLLGEFDTMESEVKGERQRSAIAQKAAEGKQTSGGHRPYGYALDYRVVSQPGERLKRRVASVALHPVEAPVVAECAKRVLAGESLISVCKDLNARGVPTSARKQWRVTTLRRMLCTARISGRREYIPNGSYEGTRPLVGEIVSNTSEWPAIISVEQSDRLRALLTAPERRTNPGGARKALLSGILVCGLCDAPMVRRKVGPKPRYVCDKNPGRGCGRVFVTADRADEHVRDVVLTALESPAMAARLRQRQAPDQDVYAQIRADEDELAALAADLGNREISRAEWRAARAPIVARLAVARNAVQRTSQTSALDGFVGTAEQMLRRWRAANTSQRRAVVTAVVERVVVARATLRHRFDPNRLTPVFLG